MSADVYPQDRVIEDYVEIGYDYYALHMKYVGENNMPGVRVLHSLFNNRELPLKSRAVEVVEEVIEEVSKIESVKPTLTFLEIIAAQKAAKENK